MSRQRAAVVPVGLAAVGVCVSGCIGFAPAPAPAVGAVGVTVDEAGLPVLVVEACAERASRVDLSWTREGLADTEQNEVIGTWTGSPTAAGSSRLVLADPGPPWSGPAFSIDGDPRGVIAGGQTSDGHTLVDVVFYTSDLAVLSPGEVRWSPGVSGQGTPVTATVPESDFATTVCEAVGE